jgi:hypothetical protein
MRANRKINRDLDAEIIAAAITFNVVFWVIVAAVKIWSHI